MSEQNELHANDAVEEAVSVSEPVVEGSVVTEETSGEATTEGETTDAE